MTKATKSVANAPAPAAPEVKWAPQPEDDPTIGMVHVRDVYAAQALSAIVGGIVSRGGLEALHTTLDSDALMRMVFRLADDALLAREA